jgi:two-component system sensor histidine kinase CpxA
MSRLYWKIFIAFWLVLLLTIIVTVTVNRLTLSDDVASSRMETLSASMDALAEQAQRTLTAAGEEGLRAWLEEKQTSLRVPIFIVAPDGTELLGRLLPPGLRGRPPNTASDVSPPRVGRERPPPGGMYEPGPGMRPVDRLTRREPRFQPRPRILKGPRGDYTFVIAGPDRSEARWLMTREMRGLFPLVLVVVSGCACFLLARYLTRPIRAFRATGQKIAAGDLTARVGAPVTQRKDEFGALANDFDRMAEKVEALLESKQRLLRDVSHELRSPLARLQAATGLMRQQLGDADDENLDRIEREAATINDMIGQILTFTRLQSTDQISPEPVDVTELVAAVVDNANYEAHAQGCTVTLHAPDQLDAELDPSMMQSAVENVVRNAVQHARQTVIVSVSATDDAVQITVTDDGPGAPEQNLDKLFDAFFTAAPSNSAAGQGAGIGLAISKRAVELHGGSISAVNRANDSGLEVRMVI